MKISRVACVALIAVYGTGCPDVGPQGPVNDAGGVGVSRDGGAVGSQDGGGVVDGGALDVPDAGRNTSDDAGLIRRDGGQNGDAGARLFDAGSRDAGTGFGRDGGPSSSTDAGDDTGPVVIFPLKVVTFNTGTTEGLDHDTDGDAYTQTQADISNEQYGNGLAWQANIENTRRYLAEESPDIIAFQEIFHPDDCADIGPQFYAGFVCETWQDGDITVAQTLLGAGYQVACNLGKNDKCVAVKKRKASIRGCNADLCLDHLDGVSVPNCGGGSRVGRAIVDFVDGSELTLVHVHGTSGISQDDRDCREAQVEQIFTDFDGAPAANGARNIVFGDFNTDPGRATLLDNSADRWTRYVNDNNADFHFISDVGRSAAPTYAGRFNIDHIVSDVFVGTCTAPGVTPGVNAVLATTYYDHTPIVCMLTE